MQGLKQYKDYCIESELSTGDKTLSFLYPTDLSKEIKEEGYIRNKTDEFVIKEVSTKGNWKSIKAKLNVEDLEGKVFESFDTTNETITDCINLALAGTGWIVGTCDVTKRRTVRKTNSSSWEIIQEARKVYRCELEFDTLNKKVNIYEKRGSDKGVYFLDSLNLKDLSIQGDSYDFYTRIIAKGKDDLKVTLENFQYSKKIKTYIWKDERYTDIESLTEDAKAKLDELSKPYRAYSATVIDLANISKENYKDILSYSLGDVITLVSKENGIKEKQRIVKMVEYPDEPYRNTCEIANTTLSFEDVQKEFQDTTDTVNNITTDNGTIDGSTINGISTEQIYDFETNVAKITDLTVVKAQIEELYAGKANIGELNAVIANIAELNATKANITDLTAINASIANLQADKANITDLTATNIKFNVASGGTLDLETLLAKHITGENGQFINISSSNTVIANAVIKDAMIENVSLNKLLAGTISTNKFTVASDNGGITIVGPTMQFKDKNNKVRIQMGQDATGNFNFILRGEDGTTTLIDHTGIKEKAIADDLIKSNMVAADAIGEKQINYSSLITGLNKDTNTSLIKASKVAIDLTGQSLEVSFNSLKSNVDNIQIGGRNLFISSNIGSYMGGNIYPLTGATYEDFKFTVTSNPSDLVGVKIINFDKELIISGETDLEEITPWWKFDNSSQSNTRISVINGKFSFKISVPDGATTLNIGIGLYPYIKSYFIKNIMIQNGNKATDWTPAPEDVDQKIEFNKTAIAVAQGKIEGLISESTITKGDITTLKDNYTSIKATVYGINTTVASHTSSIGTINTNISGLSGKVTTVENNYATLSQNLEGFKTTVGNTYSTKSELSIVDGKVSSLTSRVSTAEASITQLNNQIALKVEQTDINKAINSIQVGGRNLLKFSRFNKGIVGSDWECQGTLIGGIDDPLGGKNACYITVTQMNSYLLKQYKKVFPKNGQYTLSVWLKGSKEANFNIQLQDRTNQKTVKLTTSWQKYDLVGNITNINCQYEIVFGGWSSWDTSLGVYIAYPMLVEGNKPMDWTPAPEDVENDATNKANTAQTNAINSAQKYTDGQISSVNQTITDKVAKIKLTTDSITQKVSSTESTLTTTTTTANSALASASYANDKIDNLKIGGRNLFISSTVGSYSGGGIKSLVGATYSNYTFTVTSNPTDLVGCSVKNFGDKITVSGETNLSQITPYWKFNNASQDSTRVSVDNGKFSFNISVPSGATSLNIGVGLYPYVSGYYIKNLKIETGDKATDWTPAPEDIDSAITTVDTKITTTNNKVATIETNLNSITSRVSSTESSITTINGNVTSLQSRMTTAEQKITPTAITTTISSVITGGTGSISTTQFVMDKNGLAIKNGALTIKNKSGTTVLNSDTNGNLIVTGTLKSQSGAQFVSMNSGGIDFQDWNKNEQMLRIGISYFDSNRDMNGINFALAQYGDFIRFSHIAKADLTNGWTSSDTQYNFMDFWSGNQTVDGINYKKGINVYAPMYVNGNGILFNNDSNFTSDIRGATTWNTMTNLLGIFGDNGLSLGYRNGSAYEARIVMTEGSHPGTDDKIKSWGHWNGSGYVLHNFEVRATALSVSGSKNCIQKTESYGERLINAYETAEYYFGDLGFGKINSDGECLVYIDDIFLECVNTNSDYHVFTQIYNGKITSIERYKTYFIVKGDPGTSFSWELKAKRIGYENNRLDTQSIVDNQAESNIELFSDEDFKVETSEDTLMDIITYSLEDLLMEG